MSTGDKWNWCSWPTTPPCGTATLLRPAAWVEDEGAVIGETIFLNLPEIGIEGPAQVVSIEETFVVPSPGRLITGIFRHTSGEILDLQIEGEHHPLVTTKSHPFWSVDREDWIAAQDLQPGELLLNDRNQAVLLESITERDEPAEVYNLEIDGDHCYRVGEQGLLVHNASAATYGPTLQARFRNRNGRQFIATVGTSASITLDRTNVGGGRINLREPTPWWPELQGVVKVQLGHILGSQIGGKERSEKNLAPLFGSANSPAMSTCESFLRRLVEECGYCVQVSILIKGYGKNEKVPDAVKSVIPTSIEISWQILGGQGGVFVIANDPKATTQDPCRAKNVPCR